MSEPAAKKQRTTSLGPRITDPRFANIQSDPRYRLPGKKNKVKLDKRFAKVLQDDDFVKRAKVDRYGRPLESNAEKKRLKRKYDFDEDHEQDLDEADDDGEVQKELSKIESKIRDPLREGRETDSEDSTDETSTDDESEDEAEEMEEEVGIGQSHQQEIPTGEVTSRVALVNLDWDNIRASDLMAVFSSFLPSNGGSLVKVSIYPSEFGKERLEREEMEGPPKEIFANAAKEDNEDEDISDEEEADEDIQKSILENDDGEDFNPTALRKYQLERLRYFYAILTFSSPSVAKHIYEAVDGTEYLHTANFFDLRFVPDDTDFSGDIPRDECERMPDDYKPNEFVTDALQHSKVKLTWDAEDAGRKEAVARAFSSGKGKGSKGRKEMMDENDLQAYLASDNSDDDEEAELDAKNAKETTPKLSKKEAERQRMRSLLGLPLEPEKKSSKSKDKAPVGDMQITFTSGLGGTKDEKKRSVFENSPEPDETTVEKYVRKERERKQKRKDKLKSSREGGAAPDAETNESAVRGSADDIPEEERDEDEDLGFNDPFFAEPSTSTEKPAVTNKLRKEERLKKKKQREAEDEIKKKQRGELELLMVDDADDGDATTTNPKIRHFDMREIARAEKQARKNKKTKSKAKARDVAPNDDFNVDTSDPRFSHLFSSHEYAIDPTNPRFSGTKGMKALLEEGRMRKKKSRAVEEDGREPSSNSKEGRNKKNAAEEGNEGTGGGGGDVKKLVEKIKRRQGV